MTVPRHPLFRSRLDAVDHLAHRLDLGAIIIPGRGVITQYGYLQWIAGYCPVIRQAAALLIRGTPARLLVTSGSDVTLARDAGAITDILPVDSLAAPLGQMLVDALDGDAAPRIGVAGLGDIVSAQMIDAWRAALPAARFVDITQELLALKAVKSPTEQDQMRAVARIADDALDAIVAKLRQTGSTLAQAAGAGEALLRSAGAQEILTYVSKGPHFLHRPTQALVDDGDLITIYVELSDANGYWIELARIAARGTLSPQMQAIAGATQRAMTTAQQSLRSGRTAGQAHAVISTAIESAGYRSGLWLGHGVGIDHDLPVIGKDQTTPLEDGMTIALHPHLVDAHGGASIGDTYIVSAQGGVPLSRWSTDVIGL